MALLIRSTLATQTSKVWEVREEMDINSHRAVTDVGNGIQEKQGSKPLLKLQLDFGTEVKATKVPKVSMEKVEDSLPRSQLEGTPSKTIKPIIKLSYDLIG
jgi:hypothetical protein